MTCSFPWPGLPCSLIQRENNDDEDYERRIDEEEGVPRLQVGDVVVPYRLVLKTLEGIFMPAAGASLNASHLLLPRASGLSKNSLVLKIIMHAGYGRMDEEVWKTAFTSCTS
jgi:hypothetical protein